jgi:hypothetical protein
LEENDKGQLEIAVPNGSKISLTDFEVPFKKENRNV